MHVRNLPTLTQLVSPKVIMYIQLATSKPFRFAICSASPILQSRAKFHTLDLEFLFPRAKCNYVLSFVSWSPNIFPATSWDLVFTTNRASSLTGFNLNGAWQKWYEMPYFYLFYLNSVYRFTNIHARAFTWVFIKTEAENCCWTFGNLISMFSHSANASGNKRTNQNFPS